MFFLPSVRDEELRHREAVEKVLTFFGLVRYRHTPVAALPFGIQKLVGFARALALEPALLLLDEPSAGLSPKFVGEIMRAVGRARDTGVTILLVEQNVKAALEIADSAAVLVGGRISRLAPARELVDADLGDLFLGRAA